jgi:hypothetical protein
MGTGNGENNSTSTVIFIPRLHSSVLSDVLYGKGGSRNYNGDVAAGIRHSSLMLLWQ